MKLIKEINKEESGQTFILVLVLLLLGGLIIASLLGYMSTGLNVGQIFEERMDELYAADAGVEDALWHITTNSDDLPTSETPGPLLFDDMADVNSKQIAYTISYEGERTYKVISTATTDANSSTTIESYIAALDYSLLLDSAITTTVDGVVEIGNNSEVKGDVRCIDDDEHLIFQEQAIWDEVQWQIKDPIPEEDWPFNAGFIWFYQQDVDTLNPYDSHTLDLNGVSTSIGPEYIEGTFDIYNSDHTVATLTLDDTLYITGITTLAGQKEWILDLNGQTIFVESDVTGGGTSGTALWVGGKCTVTGSGCIIAVGDVKFQPNIISEEGQFMLVMSIEGEVWFAPGGDYFGTVVGDTRVDMQPGCTLEWVDPPTGEDAVNFPWEGYTGDKLLTKIHTWEISIA